MSYQFKGQCVDANAFENFIPGTSEIEGPLRKSQLLPIVPKESPHGGGSDDRLAGAGVVETASLLSVDSHVQSGSLFPFYISNFLVSIHFIVPEVGNGTDTENGREDASSKCMARGCCRTQ